MNGTNPNYSALESIRRPKVEIEETMYPEEYAVQMEQTAMQPDQMGAPNQVMPGEMDVDPTRPGDVFTPGVGWTRRPPVR